MLKTMPGSGQGLHPDPGYYLTYHRNRQEIQDDTLGRTVSKQTRCSGLGA